ncbi:GspE/PulE family protein [Roseateles violae]|uniref:GspE/PulE family protein n=1 Tax=Roseateles violae TaxID=3058042 RepID=A0ABT8DTS2_9BURK|nr:GspE/PulE family protein [Pelomonas sp. PFR6]MDN3921686.1 GspE/PulE family protein [Pelomonas sp. PFR6]
MLATTRNVKLGAALVEQGLLRQEDLTTALAEHQLSGQMLGRVLLDRKLLSEEQLAQAIATQLDIPFVDLRRFDVHPEVVRLLSELQARRFQALVLEDRGESCLVGVVHPSDLRSQDELAIALKRPVDLAVITAEQLTFTIDRIYRKTEQIGEFAREVERELGDDVIDLTSMGRAISDDDAPIVKLLQTIFDDAARINASDIHFEPQERMLVVRFRIDGVLHVQIEADPRIAAALMVRLKLMANLDIAERRLPQDGRFSVRSGESRFDIRMSTMPTQFGESVVLRLLRQSKQRKALNTLMPPQVFQSFDRAIRAPHGIVLVTGPTGSGKTTTLYAALEDLNSPGVKILTCEDPVEFRIAGINQVQINERIELSFARVLRSFLRQDPDILLVGEIRDVETAEIAVRAAMTGHMVLSTLHTNDAPSTPLRLLDMGVPAFMVASTLLAVVSQRLVRQLCGYCAEPATPPTDEMTWLRHYASEDQIAGARLRRGRGCSRCNGVGFSGRRGVHEVMEMTSALAQALQHANPLEFDRLARQQIGRRTLAHSAAAMVLAGETTIAEAMTIAATARADE